MGILLTILVLGLNLVIFYPKLRVVGGLRGGPIAPGETAYREPAACQGSSLHLWGFPGN